MGCKRRQKYRVPPYWAALERPKPSEVRWCIVLVILWLTCLIYAWSWYTRNSPLREFHAIDDPMMDPDRTFVITR